MSMDLNGFLSLHITSRFLRTCLLNKKALRIFKSITCKKILHLGFVLSFICYIMQLRFLWVVLKENLQNYKKDLQWWAMSVSFSFKCLDICNWLFVIQWRVDFAIFFAVVDSSGSFPHVAILMQFSICFLCWSLFIIIQGLSDQGAVDPMDPS